MLKTLIRTLFLLGLGWTSVGMAFELRVLNAIDGDQGIAHAEIVFQRAGQSSRQFTTNEQGLLRLSEEQIENDPRTTMIIRREGFSSLVAMCPCDGLVYALSPQLVNLEDVRIVLQWGARPRDLDSHLYVAQQSSREGEHIAFWNRRGHFAQLDTDQVRGFGPETITINNREEAQRYVYAVNNFSGETQSVNNLRDVRVDVYVGSTLIRTYHPTRDRFSGTWYVFMIDEQGDFVDLDRYASISARDVAGFAQREIVNQADVAQANATAERRTRAATLNTRGEAEYQEGRLDTAERLFLDAINLDPQFAQAYSNLGVLYMRRGQHSEGLFANRQAIRFASGAQRQRIIASSNFNIARIFEDAGEWQVALRYYQQAQAHREHAAYVRGIERMRTQLAR